MTENYEQTPEKSDWNFKQAFGMITTEHLGKAGYAYSKGDLKIAYNNLKAVRMLIVFKLSKEEQQEMEALEESMGTYFSCDSYIQSLGAIYQRNIIDLPETVMNDPKTQKAFQVVYKFQHGHNFETYYQRIMELLNKYGFLVGVKEDETTSGFV